MSTVRIIISLDIGKFLSLTLRAARLPPGAAGPNGEHFWRGPRFTAKVCRITKSHYIPLNSIGLLGLEPVRGEPLMSVTCSQCDASLLLNGKQHQNVRLKRACGLRCPTMCCRPIILTLNNMATVKIKI